MHPELSLGYAANCRLREPDTSDLAALAAIRRDRMAQAMLLSVPAATDDDAVRDWIDRRNREPCGAFRIVVDDTSGETAGFVQITQVHRRNGTAYGGSRSFPNGEDAVSVAPLCSS